MPVSASNSMFAVPPPTFCASIDPDIGTRRAGRRPASAAG